MSVFQPNRVTLAVLMKGPNQEMWKGLLGAAAAVSSHRNGVALSCRLHLDKVKKVIFSLK